MQHPCRTFLFSSTGTWLGLGAILLGVCYGLFFPMLTPRGHTRPVHFLLEPFDATTIVLDRVRHEPMEGHLRGRALS